MSEVRLCSVSDVEPNSAVRVDAAGHRLAVVRVTDGDGADHWYVIDDRCSHAEASLAEGVVWADDREIECPRHGSTFELETGRAITLPATRPQGVYAVRVEGDDVIGELP
ncbi:MAG: non-heme iron oxygenase ferredoxin subunit [Actinobacteria bacterium]|nr:non-heme iron oxygenase ferredoxin subunit [Actinomycetota bacterium]